MARKRCTYRSKVFRRRDKISDRSFMSEQAALKNARDRLRASGNRSSVYQSCRYSGGETRTEKWHTCHQRANGAVRCKATPARKSYYACQNYPYLKSCKRKRR
jgi:hypothetical protein